jgi:hypothetical protein
VAAESKNHSPRPLAAGAFRVEATTSPPRPAPTPSLTSQATAAAIGALGLGLGFAGSAFVPKTHAEEQLLSEPKAILKERVDQLLNQHARGMTSAAWGLFGASRLSAAMLLGLALVAEVIKQPPSAKPGAP